MPTQSQRRKEVFMSAEARRFSLFWGLLVLALFACFSSVALYQVSHRANIKIQALETAQEQSNVIVAQAITEANKQCMSTVGVREVYRHLFLNVGALVDKLSNLSINNDATRAEFKKQVDQLLILTLNDTLPPKDPSLCPPLP